MKTINFQVEDAVYEAFRAKVDEKGMKISGAFRILMQEYAKGTSDVTRETPTVKPHTDMSRDVELARAVGRPKKDPQAPFDPWQHLIDRAGEDLYMFKMYGEPHELVDARPHLTFDTVGKITGEDFRDALNTEFMFERDRCGAREWEMKRHEFFSCCAMKFFCMNKEEKIRFDEDSLSQEKYEWLEQMERVYVDSYKLTHQGKEPPL